MQRSFTLFSVGVHAVVIVAAVHLLVPLVRP